MIPILLRPRPINDAAFSVSKIIPAVTGIIALAASIGLISATQGDALSIALGAVATVAATIGPVISAFRVARIAEPQVTPLVSPQSNDGTPLVPAVPPVPPTA